MNRISLFIIAILLGLLTWCFLVLQKTRAALAACNTADNSCEAKLKSFTVPGTGGTTCTQTPDPGPFAINSEDAINLVGNYGADHWQLINASNPSLKKDSRSVWFSLQRLKGFIQDIESKTASIMTGPTTCCDTLGIRIYFGEYNLPLVNTFFGAGTGHDNYVNRTTVLMVPTYRWNGDGKDHDFNPNYYVTTGTRFNCTPRTDSLQWTINLDALTMNHGGIAPPPYPSKNCPQYMACGADFMVYAVDPKSANFNPYYNTTPSDCTQ